MPTPFALDARGRGGQLHLITQPPLEITPRTRVHSQRRRMSNAQVATMYQLARYLDAAPPSPGRRSPYLPLAEKVDQFIERRRIDDPARHRGVAAGYVVYAVNPLQASRYRERHGVSGAKSDRGDAHMLTDMVRTDSQAPAPPAPQPPVSRQRR